MVEMRGSYSEALPPAPCQVTLKGDLFKKVNLSRISNKSESMLKTYGSGGGRKGENVGSTKQPKKEHPQQNSSFKTLPKALRTQALTALTSNFGLVGLV